MSARRNCSPATAARSSPWCCRKRTLEGGLAVAERPVRGQVAEHCFQYEGKSFPVTISVGVAATTGETTLTPNELIDLADEKLFQAKHQGRNRVVA